MKNLKRLLALASAMALMVSLTACGPNGGTNSSANPGSVPVSSSANTPTEPDETKPYSGETPRGS